jgi:hypothetical protein
MAKDIGRPIASIDEARKILSLPNANKDKILNYVEPDSQLHPVTYHPVYKEQYEGK